MTTIASTAGTFGYEPYDDGSDLIIDQETRNLFGRTRFTKHCNSTLYHRLDCGHRIKTFLPTDCQSNCEVFSGISLPIWTPSDLFRCPTCDEGDLFAAEDQVDHEYAIFLTELLQIRGSEDQLLAKDEREWLARREIEANKIREHIMNGRRFSRGMVCAIADPEAQTRWLVSSAADRELLEDHIMRIRFAEGPEREGARLYDPYAHEDTDMTDDGMRTPTQATKGNNQADADISTELKQIALGSGLASSPSVLAPAGRSSQPKQDGKYWKYEPQEERTVFLMDDPAKMATIPRIVTRSQFKKMTIGLGQAP